MDGLGVGGRGVPLFADRIASSLAKHLKKCFIMFYGLELHISVGAEAGAEVL